MLTANQIAQEVAMDIAAIQDGASTVYRNNITPLLQRCASYIGPLRSDSVGPFQPSPDVPTTVASKRALQHSENLKWQQDVFHRLLHLICLTKEGLATQHQIDGCKRQVLTFIESIHPEGEWPEFTRDKLLFLQDLLFAGCITEKDYHSAKKPLILRLADQGAIIDAQDLIFKKNATAVTPDTPANNESAEHCPSKAHVVADLHSLNDASEKPEADVINKSVNSSSLKHVMGAVCRLNKSGSFGKLNQKVRGSGSKQEKELPQQQQSIVQNTTASPGPEHCPDREPPSPVTIFNRAFISREHKHVESPCLPEITDDVGEHGETCNINSQFSSPCRASITDMSINASPSLDRCSTNKSPSNSTPSRFRSIFSGLMQRRSSQADFGKSPMSVQSSKGSDSDVEDDKHSVTQVKSSRWTFDSVFKFPKKLQFDQGTPESDVNPPKEKPSEPESEVAVEVVPLENGGGQGPDIKKLKKKLHARGASTDFFIDKVLGENIKNELSRIRAEMNKSQPGQLFSNEQINAIATRLPMDKSELKKFFPQTWCERYGDIVLEVVQKEFKEHVGEMQRLNRTAKEKQHQTTLTSSSPLKQKGENSLEVPLSPSGQNKQQSQLPRKTHERNVRFSTMDENTPASPTTMKENKCKISNQRRDSSKQRLSKDMSFVEDNLDRKLEELNLNLKTSNRSLNEYGSYLRV